MKSSAKWCFFWETHGVGYLCRVKISFMSKEFNITGKCIPHLHYMADVSGKFATIKAMTEKGRYFIMNRPRQYGKTTMLFRLLKALNETSDYAAFNISFEGVGDHAFTDETKFCPVFLGLLEKEAREWQHQPLIDFLAEAKTKTRELTVLSEVITKMVRLSDKKLVVLMDEVDKSSNNQLFVSFLGMLRDKYLRRDTESDRTFHAVVLAGVHDLKTLKLKLRPGEETKYNSPWNIATDFKVDMNLQPHEIAPMLREYAQDKGITTDADQIANLLFYYTSGQPFLVSKLCKIFDEDILPKKNDKVWAAEDIENAVELLVRESNTNFDNMTKELENNPELYDLVEALLIEGRQFPFVLQDPVINLGALYGIFADQHGLAIHNRIYREVIFNYMTLRAMRRQEHTDKEFAGAYVLPGNHLDVEKLLLRFQNLLREEYSKKDRDFLERHGRLLFLAFLKPILNGHGNAFKEPQISEEKRLDVLIAYHQHKYVIELKIWRGEKAHKAGLVQLADYLDRQSLDAGFLIIFDHSEVKSWKTQRIRTKGKRIFAVWV
jgi:hypothetical protein